MVLSIPYRNQESVYERNENRHQPWCDRQVKRRARRKKRAYKKVRKSKLQTDWTRYKEMQSDHQTTYRNARNSYVWDMVSGTASNNKKLYSFCKSMKSDSCGVAPLKKDGASSLEAHDKAVILNDQFSSEYTTEDDVFQILDQVLQHRFVDC